MTSFNPLSSVVIARALIHVQVSTHKTQLQESGVVGDWTRVRSHVHSLEDEVAVLRAQNEKQNADLRRARRQSMHENECRE